MSQPFDPPDTRMTLFQGLLAAASRHGRDRTILEDADGTSLSYKRLALASLVLGRRLAREAEATEAVGLLLPNSAGLLVTLLALNAYGRVAAILNFTAGKKNLASALKTAQIRTVLTSRRFLEAAKLEDLARDLGETEWAPGRKVRFVALEDVRASLGTLDKLAGAAHAMIAPYLPRSEAAGGATAVILFTSGTEGAPKGVVLTNANLLANAQQMLAHMHAILGPGQIVFNPLPMFHSFGLTAAALAPLLGGVKVVLYPSPLHYRQIPKAVQASKATVLIATDTFLAGYARAAEPGQLASLRHVIAGAERVKAQTRELWAANGTEVLEGYGATECAPVLACNQIGANRPGSVGRLLPGIEARLEPVPGLKEGRRLYVRGPNVMAGYLLPDRPGVLVPPSGGWHDTGDIVTDRRRLRHDPRPRQALRQARRRDGVAGGGREPRRRHLGRRPARRLELPRSAQGRAARPRHRPGGRRQGGAARARPQGGLSGAVGAQGNSRGCGDPGARLRQGRPAGDAGDGEPGPAPALRANYGRYALPPPDRGRVNTPISGMAGTP